MASATLAAQNLAALDYFVQTPVTRDMVLYLAQQASGVVRCASEQPAGDLPTPPSTPTRDPTLPPIDEFIISIINQSHVQVATLMPTLVYLARLKARMAPTSTGIPSTVHRIFLASLILSAKNLNDSSPKNKHWARYTSVPGYPDFGWSTNEVNLMEKQLLGLLDWDLRITNDDLCFHLEPFLAPIRVKLAQRAERKLQQAALEREREQHAQQQAQQAAAAQAQAHAAAVAAAARRAYANKSIAYLASSQANLPHVVQMGRQRYDSPAQGLYRSYSYESTRSASSMSSSTRSYSHRTPSLSPPSLCDSSYASSLADSPTRTPPHVAPYARAALPQAVKVAVQAVQARAQAQAQIQARAQAQAHAYDPYAYDLPEVIHMADVALKTPAAVRPHPHPDDYSKPAKRIMTSATTLFSRILGAGAAAEAPSQPAPATAV